MKGHEDVIEVLSDVLSAELTAINQYFIHHEMCANWHYKRLAERSRAESIEEMKHAEKLIERILYFEGAPNMQKYMKISVGKSVAEQHKNDLALEKAAVERLNRGIEVCRTKDDNGSRALLESILRDEEAHIDWLEAQLQQIQDVGLQNYLSQQIEG